MLPHRVVAGPDQGGPEPRRRCPRPPVVAAAAPTQKAASLAPTKAAPERRRLPVVVEIAEAAVAAPDAKDF
jgi:hypothetical protein